MTMHEGHTQQSGALSRAVVKTLCPQCVCWCVECSSSTAGGEIDIKDGNPDILVHKCLQRPHEILSGSCVFLI